MLNASRYAFNSSSLFSFHVFTSRIYHLYVCLKSHGIFENQTGKITSFKIPFTCCAQNKGNHCIECSFVQTWNWAYYKLSDSLSFWSPLVYFSEGVPDWFLCNLVYLVLHFFHTGCISLPTLDLRSENQFPPQLLYSHWY